MSFGDIWLRPQGLEAGAQASAQVVAGFMGWGRAVVCLLGGPGLADCCGRHSGPLAFGAIFTGVRFIAGTQESRPVVPDPPSVMLSPQGKK